VGFLFFTVRESLFMKRKLHLSDQKFQWLLLCFSVLFYGFFTWFDGVVFGVDSPSYIAMSLAREPIYPLYLAFFRMIFGDGDFYLLAAVFVQGMLAAVAAWSLAGFLAKEFKRNRFDAAILLLLPLLVSLLCRFAAKRSSMYSNSILSEGICISLFLLFARFLLDYCFHKERKKSLFLSAVLSVVMISTRKQLLVTLMLLILAILFVEMRKQTIKQAVIRAGIYAAAVLLLVSGIDRAYNYILRGENVRHSSDDRFLLTVVFYESEKEDADRIEEQDVRQLFLDIYTICEEKGYLGHSAQKGWFNRVNHFTDHYDNIQIDTMWPMIRSFVDASMQAGEVEREMEIDRIMEVMTKSLLPETKWGVVRVFLDNVLAGFVITVAKLQRFLVIYAIIAYSIIVALWIVNVKKKGFECKENILFLYTAASCLMNVMVVSAVIFCQTRYMIYNMPLFYMCGYLLLRSVWELAAKKSGTKEKGTVKADE